MERGVTLSSDKGGLARVVSAPKEANTRYIRPILRRLLPFPSSSFFLFPFVSFRLTRTRYFYLRWRSAFVSSLLRGRDCGGLLLDRKVQVDDGEELYERNRNSRKIFRESSGITSFIHYKIFTDQNIHACNLK